jgi:uncharacterized membrane protein YgdD (TMEM256/DUF423 family)
MTCIVHRVCSNHRTTLVTAAILLALATACGAYAAHGLERVLEVRPLTNFRTGVQYQFFHALGLFGIALLRERHPRITALAVSAWLLFAGIVLFCGSLYVTAFGYLRFLTAAAPIGGACLIAGWVALAYGALKLSD